MSTDSSEARAKADVDFEAEITPDIFESISAENARAINALLSKSKFDLERRNNV